MTGYHGRPKALYVVFLLAVVSLAACTQTTIPLSEAPPLYSQYKIQAVDHWDTIADHVAGRVQKTFEDRRDLITKPVYIVPSLDGAFTRTYASLLRTRLVTRGMQVSENYEPDAVELRFTVQTVRFDSSRGDWGLSLAGLGITVVNAIVGNYTTTSNHEVVINTTMTHQNRYVMSFSQICYINDDDWKLYFNPEALRTKGISTDAVWKQYAARGQSYGRAPKPYQLPVEPGYTEVPAAVYVTPAASTVYIAPEPIIEEYVMPSGGRAINPAASPTPLGKARR